MRRIELNENDLEALLDFLAECTHDPLKFVELAFPWGEGELAGQSGPDKWQIEILKAVRDGLLTIDQAIRIAVSSGHGIGKSALVAWLILWGLSTLEDTKGVVTANTENQLKTKTWAELAKWYRLFVGKELFEFTKTAIFSRDDGHDQTWRIDMIPWSEKTTEAFAGLHNKGRRVILIFDEASAIDDKIWEVSEGALTDENTEILWFAFGNPTKNNGRFADCFKRFRHRWITKKIDSRTAKMTNKKQIQEWQEDWGEDSDFFKVRVRGEFPSASEYQFIGLDIVEEAQKRNLHESQYEFAPIIIGVDPAFDGPDEFVMYLRQGLYTKRLGVWPKNNNDGHMASILAGFEDKYKADAVFIDKGYGTGIYSFGVMMGRSWRLVAFGSTDFIKSGYKNKRAEMWGEMKQWLINGGVIEDDSVLKDDLTGPNAFVNEKGDIQLESKKEMKKRNLPSPNRADALALTFAYPVLPKSRLGDSKHGRKMMCNTDYSIF